MKYKIDHDLHIHSKVSPCSRDERQCKEAILAYGLTNGYKLVGMTDHFWDLTVDYRDAPGWLDVGNELWASSLPLPQSDNCRFLWGAEVDMNRQEIIGISRATLDTMDYCLISVGHLHLKRFVTDPAYFPRTPEFVHDYYLRRLNVLLSQSELPFEKLGLTHFTSCLIEEEKLGETLSLFSDDELIDLFHRVAEKGMGVELNAKLFPRDRALLQDVLRPFRIAKDCGCGFYMGCDAHHPEDFARAKGAFEEIIDLLALTEDDKWSFVQDQMKS